MIKFIKLLSSLVALLIVLAIVAVVGITQFVNPDHFKKEIAALVEKKTGRSLTIDGTIHWTFYPRLGIQVDHVTLGNAPDFKEEPFAEVEHIGFQVNLWHLIQGAVRVNRVFIDGAALHLIVDEKGRQNWADLSRLANYNDDTETPSGLSHVSASPSPSAAPVDISVQDLTLNRVNVSLINHVTHTEINLIEAHLEAHHIQPNENFPIKGAATVQMSPAKITDKVEFDGVLRLKIAESKVHFSPFSINQAVKLANGEVVRSHLTAQGWLDWRQGDLNLDKVEGTLGPTHVEGTMTLTEGFASPKWWAHMEATHVVAGKLTLDTLTTELKGEGGKIAIGPIASTLYGGTLSGESLLNVEDQNYSLSGKFQNVDMTSMLKSIASTETLSGHAEGSFYFNSHGQDELDLKKNLSGQARFQIHQGALAGVDLNYVSAQAQALLKGAANKAPDKGKTHFNEFTGSIEARNGLITNKDLQIAGDYFNVAGKGQYRLVDNFLDYLAQVSWTQTNVEAKLIPVTNTPLGIRVVGNPPALSYRPDFESLFKNILQEQLKNQGTQVLEKITRELGPDLGEGPLGIVERGLGNALQILPFGDALQKPDQKNAK